MISLKRYTPDDYSTWNSFVEKSKNATFLIHRDYMGYHSDRFCDHSLLFYDDDELVALFPATLDSQVLSSHQGLTYGGFILSNTLKMSVMLDLFDALIHYARSSQLSKIIYKPIPHIYHRQPAEEDLYGLFRHDFQLFRRDVSTTIDIRQPLGFSKSKKNGFSKAKQNQLEVRQTTDIEPFMRIEIDVLKRHGATPTHTWQELQTLMTLFPHHIKLFASFMKEEMIAGIVTFENHGTVHAQYMANSPLGRDIGGLDIIIHHLLHTEFCTYSYFDFGISTEAQGRYLNTGLIQQKEMFGGRAICYDQYQLSLVQ